jgi:hypothetical protein
VVLSPGPPGTRLTAGEIGARSAAVDGVVYALADRGRLVSVAYPAISRDDGRTWRVDGPCFYYAAAQGPSYVSKVGAFSARSAYMWGPFANLIRVTRNGGRTWWQTDMPDGVDRVIRRGGELLAQVGQPGQRQVYASTDGGFTWRPASRSAHALP